MRWDDEDPVLPYPEPGGRRTGGWSGSDASRERALREAEDGTLSRRQQDTLRLVTLAGTYGVTWGELGDVMGWHHGQATGALSHLHKAGRLARLREQRNKSSIYVHPGYVAGRETAPHGRRRRPPEPPDTPAGVAS